MLLTNNMIDVSKKYESGEITKEQFDHIQREAIALGNSIGQKAEAESAERFRRAMMMYNANKPVNCISSTVGNQSTVNCY